MICIAVFIIVLLQACSLLPQQRIDTAAGEYGYERLELQGGQFRHVIYRKNFQHGGDVLHVYLEGDGQPWAMPHVVSPDPTPRQPVMLRLMSYDSKPSLYIGRPCYHGLAKSPPCEPNDWTMGRYSENVVASMVAVLAAQLETGAFKEVRLFGHSGGATLAMLMAERISATSAVVSLAGNLDVAAWARHHGYSPLVSSINPAEQPALPRTIRQYHFMGARDAAIPPALVIEWARKQPGATVRVFETYDHTCCWKIMWPEFLSNLEN